MPDRKSFFFLLCIITSLALLAPVLGAPPRISKTLAASAQPDCLFVNLTLTPVQKPIYLSASVNTDTIPQVSAFAEENEEQDRVDVLDEPRVSFLIPCSLQKTPDPQSIAPRSILSLYPLRC